MVYYTTVDLSAELTHVADADSRWRLRSSNTAALVILRSRHTTSGDRAFPVTAARVWNNLPPFVSSFPSLPVFKRRLIRICSHARTLPLNTEHMSIASNLHKSFDLILSRDLEIRRIYVSLMSLVYNKNSINNRFRSSLIKYDTNNH